MALFTDVHNKPTKRSRIWSLTVQQILLIPEAIILGILLILASLWNFPPFIGLLAVITALVFGLRLALLSLAERALARGAYERADTFVRGALLLNPWSTDSLVVRAQGLTHSGDDEGAERVLRRAANLYPDNLVLQNALAATLLSQGRITEGRRLTRTYATTETTSPHAVQQLAWFALHVEDEPARARHLILQATPEQHQAPIRLPLLVTLAEANVALGTHADVREILASIEQRLSECTRPQQAELLYHLGRLYNMLDENGSRYFRRSVELDPAGRYAQIAWRNAVSSQS